MAPPNDKESDQSEPMGRSDDEEEIPMKQPANNGGKKNEADESFLDDDFLSFGNVANGGEGGSNGNNGANGNNGGNGKLNGRKRDRSSSPMPHNSRFPPCFPVKKTPTIPWLNDTTNPQKAAPPPPPPQQQYGRNNRGYNSNSSNNNQYYTPPVRTPPLIRLHNEIVSFVNLMKPTKEELQIREKMVERVTVLAHKAFGGKDKCEVLPFGSQVTGLCLPGSDIDFVIRFPEKSKNDAKKKSEKTDDDEEEDFTGNPLHRFADAVRDEFGIRSELEVGEFRTKEEDDSEHLSYLEVIEQTRVPLVKFTVAPYNIDIDVCFQQPHGPESANLMHRFMESMPPLRPLTFVLKYFLASRDINKPFTGGIGSYLLQLMIVSYLQHRAREDRERNLGAEGKHFNLGSLLLDFFEFYGMDFNYVTTGISVRHDGFYFAKGQPDKKKVFWQPSKQFTLAMENPLDISANVGTGAYRMQMIHRIFSHAFKTLLAYVSEPLEPTDSILSTIIPPTKEMEKRAMMKKDVKVDEAAEEEFSSGGNDDVKKRKRADKKNRDKKSKEVKKKRRDVKQPKPSGGSSGDSSSNKSKRKKRKEKKNSK